MIPAPFDYLAPTTVEEALAALAEHGDDAKILAGGQSLLPVLRMRLNAPEVVIDLNRIESLRGIRDDGDAIVIGAMTQHVVVEHDPLVAEHAGLISKAVEHLADHQIRHRGTFGGALAHADPAGDLGAPALALGAQFVIQGPGGSRTVEADDFFIDLFETAIGEDEILTEIRVPKHTGWGAHYEKFVRVAHQWPIVAIAATVRIEGGVIAEARVGMTNMGSTPLRARSVEAALQGQPATDSAVRAAAAMAADGANPPTDLNGEASYRSHLATVLTRRAVLAAAGGRDALVDLTHRFTVPTSVEETWAHFQDIASVGECFPGATVTSVEGDTFQGTCKVKLGPIALVYSGTGTFLEKDEAAHMFVVDAKGKDKRGNGTAGAKVRLTMEDSAQTPGSTDVQVVTDLAITGKPAQFGRGVMQDVSDKLLGQFVACLEKRLTAEPEPEVAPAAVAEPAPEVAAAGPTPGIAAVAETPTYSPPPKPRPVAAAPAGSDDALDLGAAVIPILLKTYWKQGVGVLGLIALVVVWLRGRK